MKYIHKGEDRPFIYVTNYGDIILKDGCIVTAENDRVYVSGVFEYPEYHRYCCYLSNVVCPWTYGFGLSNDKMSEILENDILKGTELTPLEYDNKRISEIVQNLPKRDLYLSHYQFSNQIRPTSFYKFEGGSYIKDEFYSYTPDELAWYIYRNLFKVLPEGITKCDAKLWESLHSLHDDSKYDKPLFFNN